MVKPVGLVGQSLVDAVVEVLVVGEDDVTADIVELNGRQSRLFFAAVGEAALTKPSGVTSVEARPPGTSLSVKRGFSYWSRGLVSGRCSLSTIIHDGPS